MEVKTVYVFNLFLLFSTAMNSNQYKTHTHTHPTNTPPVLSYLRCEGQRPEPGLLALSSCMAGTGLEKRWQKQNMAQTSTPEGARPS